MTPKVFLSSTLSDLQLERAAAREVLAGDAMVLESFVASEDEILADAIHRVAEADVYVGIIGLRYGFIPPGETKSLTHLEYDEAAKHHIPRIVFIKEPSATLAAQTDAATGEHPKNLIDNFRAQINSEVRPARFSSIDELKFGLLKAISEYRLRKTGGTALFKANVPAAPPSLKDSRLIDKVDPLFASPGQASSTSSGTAGSARTSSSVFVCYRREDTQDAAGRLYDRLVYAYGSDQVFMDIDSVWTSYNTCRRRYRGAAQLS